MTGSGSSSASSASVTEERSEVSSRNPRGKASVPRESSLRVALGVTRIGPVLILILLCLGLAIASPAFSTLQNIANIGTQTSVVAVLALGEFLVILTSGIDLSVGSTLSLTSVIGAMVATNAGLGNVGIAAMLAVGMTVGLVNGVVLVKWKMPTPFIVTLGMLNAAGGLALIVSNGNSIVGAPSWADAIGVDTIHGVPVAVLFAAALAVIVYVFTSRIQLGRWLYTIGGNMEGARRVGIPVGAVLVGAYVASGLFAACASMIQSGRANAGYPTAGLTLELDAIAAVIIGGASFLGGRGNVFNVIVGALVLGVIQNGLDLLNVPSAWQQVAVGVVLVVAVALDVLRARLEERTRTMRAKEG